MPSLRFVILNQLLQRAPPEGSQSLILQGQPPWRGHSCPRETCLALLPFQVISVQ
jgi:hypothetical protein